MVDDIKELKPGIIKSWGEYKTGFTASHKENREKAHGTFTGKRLDEIGTKD